MQTRRPSSLSDIDNTPQSLLAFSDKNVHALYDFLLNYRQVYCISWIMKLVCQENEQYCPQIVCDLLNF